ncbi:MAG: GNAT family N-acetyltransferase [Bacteroidota bacterium]
MQDQRFQIHEGPIQDGYTSNIQLPIYYHDEYLKIQGLAKARKHSLLDIENKQVVGQTIFCESDSAGLVSLPAAPFGSVYCDTKTDTSVITNWLQAILQQGMVVRHPPAFYQNLIELPATLSFHRRIEDINHHIELSNYHLGKLHNMQIRRVRKCKKAGFDLEIVDNPEELESLYDFIKMCRQEQGLVINISREKFLQSFLLLPNYYQALRIVTTSGHTIAATVVVKVMKKIAYNYLPASTKAYHNYSPMAFLLFRTALLYQQQGFDILDLGISSIDGSEQSSLAQFKERMGAARTAKYTYFF